MAAIESFEDVRRLTEPELRSLLERGRPEERVWAIWALALRSTQPASEVELLAQRDEPAPGVRRNFAVVLAAHGQYDLLVALAKRDPASIVRAAAMQLVTRIAIDGKLSPSIVTDRLRGETADVKVAVLGTIFERAPAWLVDVTEPLLDDRDSEVRLEAHEALLRAGRMDRAVMWLEEAPDGDARLALMRWTAHGRVRAVAEALRKASRRLRRLLIESVQTAHYHELAPAIGEELPLLRALCARGRNIVHEIPLVVLVRSELSGQRDPWIQVIASRLGALSTPDPDLAPLLSDLCERCTVRIADIDRAIRDVRDDVEREELEDLRDVYTHVLDHAARLVVH